MKTNLSLANDCRAGSHEQASASEELTGNLQRVRYPCVPGMSIVRRAKLPIKWWAVEGSNLRPAD